MSDVAPNVESGLPVWRFCYTCQDYLSDVEKRLTLADRLGEKAKREGREVAAVVDEFMEAAHDRHLTGEPLRQGGPTRVTDPWMGRLAALLGSVLPPARPAQ